MTKKQIDLGEIQVTFGPDRFCSHSGCNALISTGHPDESKKLARVSVESSKLGLCLEHFVSPFKFFAVDGGDWVIVDPKYGKTIAHGFKDFHGRVISKKAKIMVVHPSFQIGEGGLTNSAARGAWQAVEVA